MLTAREECKDRELRAKGFYKEIEVPPAPGPEAFIHPSMIRQTEKPEPVMELTSPWADPANHCKTLYIGPDSKTYRLVAKPLARKHRLERAGFEVVTEKDEPHVDGPIYVRVYLGAHGADHLGIDLKTGKVACLLCEGE